MAGAPDEAALAKLRRGIFIDGGRTAPAEVLRGSTVKSGGVATKLTLSLREGRNRQVRKMCQAIGHPVRLLTRVRMGQLTLGRLRPGEWRELTASEVKGLKGRGRPSVGLAFGLFRSQCGQRIHPARAPRGQPAGDERHRREHEHDEGDGQRIGGLHLVEAAP